MMQTPVDVAAALASVPLFRGLDDRTLQRIAEMARERDVEAGQIVVRQGEAGDELLVLLAGSLRITAHGAGGEEIFLAVVCSGEVIGEMALLDAHPRSATVTALEPSRLAAIARTDFLGLLEAHPRVAITMLTVMAQRTRQVNEHLTEVTGLDVYQRLIRQIERLAGEHGEPSEGGVRIRHPVSAEMLAGLCAARPVAVDRICAGLEADGLIRRQDGHLWIADLAALLRRPTPIMY